LDLKGLIRVKIFVKALILNMPLILRAY
jgi:hypothetical protein